MSNPLTQKRTTKERIELFKSAGEEVHVSLLPVIDDLERALEHDNYEGMNLNYTKLKTTLNNQGLKEMETKKGDEFNTDSHEAITKVPSKKGHLLSAK